MSEDGQHFQETTKPTAEELFSELAVVQKSVADDLRYRYLASMKDGSVQAIRARSALEAYKIAQQRDDIVHIKRELLDRIEMVEKSRMVERSRQDLDLPVFKNHHQLIALDDFDALGIDIQKLSDIVGDDHGDFETATSGAEHTAPAVHSSVDLATESTPEALAAADVLLAQDAIVDGNADESTAEATTAVTIPATDTDTEGLSAEEIERLLNG